MTLEEFEVLTRDEMVKALRGMAPTLVKGKTRASRRQLVEIYKSINAPTITGRTRPAPVIVGGPYPSGPVAGKPEFLVDDTELETRMMAAVMPKTRTKIPLVNIPTGGENITIKKQSRRSAVYEAVSQMPKDKIRMLQAIKALSSGNYKARRVRKSLMQRIRRYLPGGISLEEALMIMG